MEAYLGNDEVKIEIIENEKSFCTSNINEPVNGAGPRAGVAETETRKNEDEPSPSSSVQELVDYFNGMTFDPSSFRSVSTKAGTPLSLLQITSADDHPFLQRENADSAPTHSDHGNDHKEKQKEEKVDKTPPQWDIYEVEVAQDAADLFDIKAEAELYAQSHETNKHGFWYYKISDMGRNLPLIQSKSKTEIQKLGQTPNELTTIEEEQNFIGDYLKRMTIFE